MEEAGNPVPFDDLEEEMDEVKAAAFIASTQSTLLQMSTRAQALSFLEDGKDEDCLSMAADIYTDSAEASKASMPCALGLIGHAWQLAASEGSHPLLQASALRVLEYAHTTAQMKWGIYSDFSALEALFELLVTRPAVAQPALATTLTIRLLDVSRDFEVLDPELSSLRVMGAAAAAVGRTLSDSTMLRLASPQWQRDALDFVRLVLVRCAANLDEERSRQLLHAVARAIRKNPATSTVCSAQYCKSPCVFACSACLLVYCSPQCQRRDWQQRHKDECARFTEYTALHSEDTADGADGADDSNVEL